MKTLKPVMLSFSLVAALAAAGCSGGGSGGGSYQQGNTMPAPPPTQSTQAFTNWSKYSVFAKAEDGTPIDMDMLTFAFDGDDNLNAYSELFPAG